MFKVGDVVKIKGQSGTKMTVNSFTDDSMRECVWFDQTGTLQKHFFPVNVLEIITENKVTKRA